MATQQLVCNILEFYYDDLPSPMSMDIELDMWFNAWSGNTLGERLYFPGKVLHHIDSDYFPNIHTLMVLLVTLPVTSCESERSISLLQLIKSRLKSIMIEDRLNSLALMYYHKDIPIDPEDVITQFAQAKTNQRNKLIM